MITKAEQQERPIFKVVEYLRWVNDSAEKFHHRTAYDLRMKIENVWKTKYVELSDVDELRQQIAIAKSHTEALLIVLNAADENLKRPEIIEAN